ncbi:L,D-transpeptidase family protein [Halocynthiibacter styelae]|uniref:L,D-transpeptidase family protein n=1 Tax=Halocynthiibacter styelae TaxID=2761955 RepID=A0A8J7IHP8_9RHOB|nr:L,D-transpeptidase family protein [Paenihalocynthiibacter styelae]MBI1492353.1 L,D-transpeptidase family protein [Paenihalocynthiibacter styelae]
MKLLLNQFGSGRAFVFACAVMLVAALTATTATAQDTAFRQAVAEAASGDDALAEFYRTRNYESVWTGRSGRERSRRRAFLTALNKAGDHGLPVSRYNPDEIRSMLRSARSARERGLAEVKLSEMYVAWATDLKSGIIRNPRRIDDGIVREISRPSTGALMNALIENAPNALFRSFAPRTPEYTRLMEEKTRFERLLARGGWGATVPGSKYEPGNSGAGVVALRDRLIAMGYIRRSSTQTYDASIQAAVQQFQLDHGLNPDGVAGEGTLREINTPAANRLSSILVAMERERWFNQDRGQRHVLVNIPDFQAKIIDNGQVTFETRSVVGANDSDRRTPEFSDVMEHMVINPTWNVPRSIAVNEYLPMMQRNPGAAGHLRLVNARGQTVDRSTVDFTQYNERTFPFNLKQPPSRRNALGLVKFMFPNRYNIYLHDTPAKNLFSRETRAFSHGCVRLNDPFDFAYALLAAQMSNPEAFFQERLNSGQERVVPLETQVPVHLIYRTAVTQPRGNINFRRDIYGRDRKIWDHLSNAGVELRAQRS